MQAVFAVLYFGLGVVQLFAIVDGVQHALGLPGFIAFLLALFTTWIPLLGTVLGVYGAVNVWRWDLIPSLLLFGLPLIIASVFLLTVGIAGLVGKRR